MTDLFSVKDKVVVVTGGAHGLGFAYAKGFLEHGAKVAICDINEGFLKEAEEALSCYPGRVFSGRVDVTSAEQIKSFVDQVEAHYGRIDVLVNNAGVLIRKFPEEMNEADWDFVSDINVKGTFLFAIEVGKRWIAKGEKGKIVNISSQTGLRAADRRLVYCTTKAAIIQFTRTLANEWGKYGINVNAIGPGYIKTDMNKDLRADPQRYQSMKDEVPQGDFGLPEDLVGTMIYLTSSASDYVTGQVVFVDGGLVTK